jgi:hypothetical protein
LHTKRNGRTVHYWMNRERLAEALREFGDAAGIDVSLVKRWTIEETAEEERSAPAKKKRPEKASKRRGPSTTKKRTPSKPKAAKKRASRKKASKKRRL